MTTVAMAITAAELLFNQPAAAQTQSILTILLIRRVGAEDSEPPASRFDPSYAIVDRQ